MRWTVFLLSAAIVFAQGTKPKPSPTDYDVHGQSGPLDIGAEYMVHSYSAGEQMYLIQNYLVVEVALYPLMKDDPVSIDLRKFSLRLNNKTVLTPHSAAQAAASLTRSPWSMPRSRGAAGGVGIGGINIPIGGQPAPGGPQDRRPPQPPRAPDADPPGGIERERDNPDRK